MTMTQERTRSVVQTRDFLKELSRDQNLPENIRDQAKILLRHYPTGEAVWLAGKSFPCWLIGMEHYIQH